LWQPFRGIAKTIDYEALAAFRYEVRRFLHFAEQAAGAAGIEPHQYQALLAIRGLPVWARATIGILAESLQIRHHSADRSSVLGAWARQMEEEQVREHGWIAGWRGASQPTDSPPK